MKRVRSRRGFFRSAIGGLVAFPAILRSQLNARDSSQPVDRSGFATIRPDSTSLGDSTVSPGDRPHAPGRNSVRKRGFARSEPPPPIKPPALINGSTIALVAPASGVTHAEAIDAAATLKNLGFNVKLGKYLTKGFGYLAATDDLRAEEFMGFVRDPDVACIMAVRGGYGVMRILPLLDFAEIRAHPKVIVGYSDITALVNSVFQCSGMIAFHGPVATSTFDKYTLDSFSRTVMSASPAGTFGESDEFHGSIFTDGRAATIVPGIAQGRLVGGNLSLVTALMGTPYDIETRGRILFLEEVEEEPYHIDRMLTQLALAGKFAECAGVALGRFNKCEVVSHGEFHMSLSIEQVVRGVLEPLNIPAVYGLAIGHIKSKLTVPVGALATLDTEAKTLTIDEAAVST